MQQLCKTIKFVLLLKFVSIKQWNKIMIPLYNMQQKHISVLEKKWYNIITM